MNGNAIRFLRVFLCLPLLVVTSAWATDDIPKRPPFHSYAAMIRKSPFALATAHVGAALAPNFAKDLYIANVRRTPNGVLVTIKSAVDPNFSIQAPARN